MSVAVIQQRLLSYQSQTILEQENALKEIMQEIALMALSRAGFFKIAAFQGGTCLRILYGLERFSEDLDFILENPDKNFSWDDYINNMHDEFLAYGYALEAIERSKLAKNIKMAFLKAESNGGILILKDTRTNKPKLKIKLEIDTNPPADSKYELKFLDFPLPYSVKLQDLSSLFAGKCHTLLCREYSKGRDWFDFIWYVARLTPINYLFLQNALKQVGPWQGKDIIVTSKWLLDELELKINAVNWNAAKQDLIRFLKPRELSTLELWSKEFFISRLEKLSTYI